MTPSLLMLLARIFLGVCLYGFLGVTLIYLWRDLRAGSAAQAALPPQSVLRLLGLDDTVQRAFTLVKNSCLIGRSPTTEIPVADETVSAVHARVWRKEGRWRLEDLNSRNGTFLNEIPVEKMMVLCEGDRIRVGRRILVFSCDAPGGSIDPPPSGGKSAPAGKTSPLAAPDPSRQDSG
jgi:pSer/pThr/pTyr-binding forkhead associated (FHA) protein